MTLKKQRVGYNHDLYKPQLHPALILFFIFFMLIFFFFTVVLCNVFNLFLRALGSHLYRLLRPEFVNQYKTALCSDSFAHFIAVDPNRKVYSRAIKYVEVMSVHMRVCEFVCTCECACARVCVHVCECA